MRIVDNTPYVKSSMTRQMGKGLVAVGLTLEGYAKLLCPVDTGRLRSSITFDVRDGTVYIGTNVEYAPYVEYGTKRQKPQPYIRPAVQDHLDECQQILEQYLKG